MAGNGPSNLIGESLDHQGMRRVDIVVMNGELRASSPRLSDGMSDSLALQQVEIQGGGEDENFSGTVARDCGRQHIYGDDLHSRTEAENRLASGGHRTRVPADKIGSER